MTVPTLGVESTSAAPTIEDTMTSVSLVLNGGGLSQLETIVREANLVLDGNEGTARDLLGRLQPHGEGVQRSPTTTSTPPSTRSPTCRRP